MVAVRRSRARVLARLVAVASTLFALGTGAHVIGHGELPPLLVLGALAALTFAVSAVLAQWRLRVSTLLPAATVWQWFLHVAFSGTAMAGSVVVDDGIGHLGHEHVNVDVVAMPAMAPHAMSSRMLVAHLLATIVTVALLVATERGVARGIEYLAWVLPALLGTLVLPVVTPIPGPVVARRRAVRQSQWWVAAHGSRGPPAWALTA